MAYICSKEEVDKIRQQHIEMWKESIMPGQGWSVSQKEAIRERLTLITQKVFTYGCLAGRGDALSSKQEEYVDKGLWVDELMDELEAIEALTRKEEQ